MADSLLEKYCSLGSIGYNGRNTYWRQKMKRKAVVNTELCVSCGACAKICPRGAVAVYKGMYAQVNEEKCIGCGLCAKTCPASVITVVTVDE